VDLMSLLAELREEAARIHEAIAVIESLVPGGGKQRGRPPKASLSLGNGHARAPNVPGESMEEKLSEE
jgi:hypothetical protein